VLLAVVGACSGFLAVALGAFAAHGVRGRVSPEMLAVFETGARYHMYHALALVVTGWIAASSPQSALTVAGWLFVAGTVVFSGSLYALVLTGAGWLGAITPIGGLLLLAGWVALAVGLWALA
jgi:uncharacterized membrane protein YgdD (TMEM256/DUF423 family)